MIKMTQPRSSVMFHLCSISVPFRFHSGQPLFQKSTSEPNCPSCTCIFNAAPRPFSLEGQERPRKGCLVVCDLCSSSWVQIRPPSDYFCYFPPEFGPFPIERKDKHAHFFGSPSFWGGQKHPVEGKELLAWSFWRSEGKILAWSSLEEHFHVSPTFQREKQDFGPAEKSLASTLPVLQGQRPLINPVKSKKLQELWSGHWIIFRFVDTFSTEGRLNWSTRACSQRCYDTWNLWCAERVSIKREQIWYLGEAVSAI